MREQEPGVKETVITTVFSPGEGQVETVTVVAGRQATVIDSHLKEIVISTVFSPGEAKVETVVTVDSHHK